MFRPVHEFSGVQRSTTKHTTWTRAGALLAGVLTCAPVSAAPSRIEAPRHELSEAAREPLQRGLVAAQQQDWKLAIRYLTDAEKADPDAPEILFDLGLASSKLPGYELRSMAWFQAYLLADPDAPNAKAVRNQLLTSEIAFESKLGKILDQLESVAAVIQTNRMAFLGTVPKDIVPNLAGAHNFGGDTAGAARLLATYGLQESAIANDHTYVNSVASTGRFADAVRLDYYNSMEFLYEQGDLSRAREALLSKGDDVSAMKWEDLACAAYEAGDAETLQSAVTKVSSLKHPYESTENVEDFFISIGKPDEAKKLAAAPNSGTSSYLLYLEGKLAWKAQAPTCDRHFWWGKNRRKYLIDFALNGLVLDSKSKLDDTQLDDFLTQQGALMTGSGSGQADPMQEYLRVTNPLDYTSSRIEEMAKAYRIIRGSKSD